MRKFKRVLTVWLAAVMVLACTDTAAARDNYWMDHDGFDGYDVPGGYDYNSPSFVYDSGRGQYLRSQFGEPQIDEETGEQLAVKNILIQNSSWEYYESGGYLNIHTDDPGTGKYITNGKAIDITWKKTDPWGPTYYYDMEGNPITLNEGKTWVCIVLDTYADQTHIE